MAPTMQELVCTLCECSEKAARIARACREEMALFTLLVEEKDPLVRREGFVRDFKTLADVLVQEAVRHDLVRKWPQLETHIHGEENNQFTNALGCTATVEVKDTEEETAKVLAQVLDENVVAANTLAKQVHSVGTVDIDLGTDIPDVEVSMDDIDVWIDPIDSTAEYIRGARSTAQTAPLQSGLHCVTVLIGMYNRNTGLPVAGVVNQPFYTQNKKNGRWIGRLFWGFEYGGHHGCSIPVPPRSSDLPVVVSSNETDHVRHKLSTKYQVKEVSGAGYKMLCVALGLANAFVLSLPTTYFWDACAPHCLLRGMSGRAVQLNGKDELVYNTGGKWSNLGGIIATPDDSTLQDMITLLKS